jgi:hypothetical protein
MDLRRGPRQFNLHSMNATQILYSRQNVVRYDIAYLAALCGLLDNWTPEFA